MAIRTKKSPPPKAAATTTTTIPERRLPAVPHGNSAIIQNSKHLARQRCWLVPSRGFVFGFFSCWVVQYLKFSTLLLKDESSVGILFAPQEPVQVVQQNHKHVQTEYHYTPSYLEDYVWTHAPELKLNVTLALGCTIWKDRFATKTHPRIHNKLLHYYASLENYTKAIHAFSWLQDNNITDVRKHLHQGICNRLEVSPLVSSGTGNENSINYNNINAFFSVGSGNNNTANVLSYSNQAGYMEPILPPMRSPKFCFRKEREKQQHLLDLGYLVHDFAAKCRTLTSTSRIVILDLGASPKFGGTASPWFVISELYRKFGFHVNHIYAYEVTKFKPQDIYSGKMVPPYMLPAYHWINAGVSTQPGNPLHPWTMLEREFDENDFIIVKLDIDTPDLELTLAKQLVDSPKLCKLIDVLYFEYHVFMKELDWNWGKTMRGTMQDSMELFRKLRQQGVAAHSWV